MPLSREPKIPSRGYTFHFTTQPTHTIDGPNAGLPALPTYPVADNDANWNRLYCLSGPQGLADFDIETTPFRCGDPEAAVIENFATGYKELGEGTIRLTFGRDAFELLRAAQANRTKVRYLFTFPLRAGEVRPTRFAARGYVTKATAMFDDNGSPVMIDLTVQKSDDIPVFEKGADV